MFEDDSFCEDFYMDEVDIISIENYEELFGNNTLNNAEAVMENAGMDSLLETSAADSACEGAAVAEVCTPFSEYYFFVFHLQFIRLSFVENGQGGCSGRRQAAAACSGGSADSMTSSKTEPILGFTLNNISFSCVTGESTAAADYQDCGVSFLMGEPPPQTPCGSRSDAVLRYKEKKKTRK